MCGGNGGECYGEFVVGVRGARRRLWIRDYVRWCLGVCCVGRLCFGDNKNWCVVVFSFLY